MKKITQFEQLLNRQQLKQVKGGGNGAALAGGPCATWEEELKCEQTCVRRWKECNVYKCACA